MNSSGHQDQRYERAELESSGYECCHGAKIFFLCEKMACLSLTNEPADLSSVMSSPGGVVTVSLSRQLSVMYMRYSRMLIVDK